MNESLHSAKIFSLESKTILLTHQKSRQIRIHEGITGDWGGGNKILCRRFQGCYY